MDNMADGVFDVIVVGAGIEGSATAYTTAKRGQKTLLLEQFTLPHSRGSSHGVNRMTRKTYDYEIYVNMMVEAYPLWNKLESESNTQLFKETGLMFIDREPYDFTQKSVATFQRYNLPYKEFSSDELNKKYPMLNVPEDTKGCFDINAGVLKGNKALLCYQTMFKQFGGVLRDGEAVIEIIPGDIVQVKTSKGIYRARSLIITSGAWTNSLLQHLQLKLPFNTLGINVYAWEGKEGQKRFPHMSMIDKSMFGRLAVDQGVTNIYSWPADEDSDCMKACLHTGYPTDPNASDADQRTGDMDVLRGIVRTYYPTVEENSPCTVWRCMYTMTPDLNPVIDVHPKWKNIVIGAGFSGHGFKLAPVVGKVLTELAMREKPSYDLSLFRIDRFQPKSSL